MKDDLLSQALATLRGNEARPYTIKVGAMELSANGAEDHALLLDTLKHLAPSRLGSCGNAAPLL